MYMTVDEFYRSTIGRTFDMDGAPKNDPFQCADYFKKACQELIGYHFATGGDGYVDNWWAESMRAAHKHEFDYITDYRDLKNGDFVIWGHKRRYPNTLKPFSHIAMYYNGNKVGQNQNGVKCITSVPESEAVWANMIGAYRFKVWANDESSKDKEKNMLRGIDISNHQGKAVTFDLSKLDFDFMIAKSTEGIGFVDPYCDDFVQYCIKNNKKWGFYHFARPTNDPVREAHFWYENTKNYFGHGLPVLDIEIKDPNVVSWCYTFLSEIIKLTGVKPLVYMSEQSFEWAYDWTPVVSLDCGLWIAAYRENTIVNNYNRPSGWKAPVSKHWPFYCMWQYTSHGRLTGYTGNLDLNEFYGDETIWDMYVTSNAAVPPTADDSNPVEEPKQDEKPNQNGGEFKPVEPIDVPKTDEKFDFMSLFGMSNGTYDKLKYFLLIFVPAFMLFVTTFGNIWQIEITDKIVQTIEAFRIFLGSILIISSKQYLKILNKKEG